MIREVLVGAVFGLLYASKYLATVIERQSAPIRISYQFLWRLQIKLVFSVVFEVGGVVEGVLF